MTDKITRSAMFRDGSSWYNGPVVFQTEVLPNGVVMLAATNATSEKMWFETDMFILMCIGIRGGVKILTCKGMISRQALS